MNNNGNCDEMKYVHEKDVFREKSLCSGFDMPSDVGNNSIVVLDKYLDTEEDEDSEIEIAPIYDFSDDFDIEHDELSEDIVINEGRSMIQDVENFLKDMDSNREAENFLSSSKLFYLASFSKVCTEVCVVEVRIWEPGIICGMLTTPKEDNVSSNTAKGMACRCSDVSDNALLLKSDLFLRITRISKGGRCIPICKTWVLKDNLNPVVDRVCLTMQQFESEQNPLVIECFDSGSSDTHQLIVKFQKSEAEWEMFNGTIIDANLSFPLSALRLHERVEMNFMAGELSELFIVVRKEFCVLFDNIIIPANSSCSNSRVLGSVEMIAKEKTVMGSEDSVANLFNSFRMGLDTAEEAPGVAVQHSPKFRTIYGNIFTVGIVKYKSIRRIYWACLTKLQAKESAFLEARSKFADNRSGMMEVKNSGVVEESESALNVLMEAVQMKSELNKGQIMQHKVLQVVNSKSFQLFIERDWKFGDFAEFRAKSLSNTWMERDRWALIEKQIYAFAESLEDEAEDCLKEAVQERVIMFRVNDIHATDIFLAEIEIYERFTSKCYKGWKSDLLHQVFHFGTFSSRNVKNIKVFDPGGSAFA